MSSSSSQASIVPKSNVNSNSGEKGKQQQDNGLFSQKQSKSWSKKREAHNYPKAERKPAAVVSKKVPQERRCRQKWPAFDCWDNQVNVDVDPNGETVGKRYSSKKHNLNHLLNFSFTPRDARTQESYCNQKFSSKYMKYTKERFLQANCQFIVKQGNDYSKHKFDPDLPVDWDLVEEVRFNSLTSEAIVCPICLHTPNAAKITKCGHIYCWSCILHYLALSDQSFRKCPICYDAVYRRDLRSVLSVKRREYKVGDDIVMCLMKRKRGLAISGLATQKGEASLLNIDGDDTTSLYHKLLIASPSQVLKAIVSREKLQLENQIMEEGATPEACFIESALHNLKEREDAMKIAAKSFGDKLEETACKLDIGSFNLESTNDCTETGSSERDDHYYFYQSNDGQHIYMHSLNVRMLCAEYGSLEKCPTQVTAKIVEMEWASMNDERRKRHRYMQHLPLTCEFRIVELDLNCSVVSQKTIDLFKTETLQRQKERKRRIREENRRDRNLTVEQQKKIHGIYPLPRYQLNDLHHFPFCSNELVASPPSPVMSDELNVDDSEEVLDMQSISEAALGSSPHSEEFPSFASMLREGKTKRSPPLTEKCGQQLRTVSLEDDDYVAKPLHQYSLSDAFAAALSMKDTKRKKKSKK